MATIIAEFIGTKTKNILRINSTMHADIPIIINFLPAKYDAICKQKEDLIG